MMKGTYACLKYGAYYTNPCERHTMRAALVANIDPAHQYEEYLQRLEDIRWGHHRDFRPVDPTADVVQYVVQEDKLTWLFDSVFTFNRRILNDEKLAAAWDLNRFATRLCAGDLDDLLRSWEGDAS